MARRPLTPDKRQQIALHGTACRLAATKVPFTNAIAELRDIAGDRRDLVGQAIGSLLGGYLGDRSTNPYNLAAAGLLAQLRHDHDVMVAAFETTRANASRPAHKNPS